jgi:hypothetical protein
LFHERIIVLTPIRLIGWAQADGIALSGLMDALNHAGANHKFEIHVRGVASCESLARRGPAKLVTGGYLM